MICGESFFRTKEVFESEALILRREQLVHEALEFSSNTPGHVKITYKTDHASRRIVISKIKKVTREEIILGDRSMIPKRVISDIRRVVF